MALAENDVCLALGEVAGEPDRLNWWASVIGAVAVVQDYRVGALAEAAEQFADQFPGARCWRGTAVLALADRGGCEAALETARRYQLTPSGLLEEQFPYFGPAVLARTAFRCRAAELAADAERVIAPHRSRWAHWYTGISGPLTAPLGLCASVLARHDEAVALLEDAVEQLRAAALPVLMLPHEVELASVLHRRGSTGDRSRVTQLCADVAERAEQAGCFGTAAEARRLLASC